MSTINSAKSSVFNFRCSRCKIGFRDENEFDNHKQNVKNNFRLFFPEPVLSVFLQFCPATADSKRQLEKSAQILNNILSNPSNKSINIASAAPVEKNYASNEKLVSNRSLMTKDKPNIPRISGETLQRSVGSSEIRVFKSKPSINNAGNTVPVSRSNLDTIRQLDASRNSTSKVPLTDTIPAKKSLETLKELEASRNTKSKWDLNPLNEQEIQQFHSSSRASSKVLLNNNSQNQQQMPYADTNELVVPPSRKSLEAIARLEASRRKTSTPLINSSNQQPQTINSPKTSVDLLRDLESSNKDNIPPSRRSLNAIKQLEESRKASQMIANNSQNLKEVPRKSLTAIDILKASKAGTPIRTSVSGGVNMNSIATSPKETDKPISISKPNTQNQQEQSVDLIKSLGLKVLIFFCSFKLCLFIE